MWNECAKALNPAIGMGRQASFEQARQGAPVDAEVPFQIGQRRASDSGISLRFMYLLATISTYSRVSA